MDCCCHSVEGAPRNIIELKHCITNIFLQSFILGAICCSQRNESQKTLGIPQRDEVMKLERINEETLSNLLLRVQYQSLRVNIVNVTFDLFNRDEKNGTLGVKPSSRSSTPNASAQVIWNVLCQGHNAFVLLKNRRIHDEICFGVAEYDKSRDMINIRVHHQSIAMYDVFDKEQEWILYAAPYCVKHALLSLFQKCIDRQNSRYST